MKLQGVAAYLDEVLGEQIPIYMGAATDEVRAYLHVELRRLATAPEPSQPARQRLEAVSISRIDVERRLGCRLVSHPAQNRPPLIDRKFRNLASETAAAGPSRHGGAHDVGKVWNDTTGDNPAHQEREYVEHGCGDVERDRERARGGGQADQQDQTGADRDSPSDPRPLERNRLPCSLDCDDHARGAHERADRAGQCHAITAQRPREDAAEYRED